MGIRRSGCPSRTRSLKGRFAADSLSASHLSARFLDHLGGVELVRELLEHPQARLGHVEEPFERERLDPAEIRAGLEHPGDGRAVAAEGDMLDALAPGAEHPCRFGRGGVDELALLLAPAPPEAVGGRAAL